MKKFSLYEFTGILRDVAESHPFVNTVLFDRYQINDAFDVVYPVITYFINSTRVNGSATEVDVNILYADKMTGDRKNEREIHSLGTQVLAEMCNSVVNNFDVDKDENITIRYFKNQYADEVAGAVAENVVFTFGSDLSDCDEYCVESCYKG